MIAILLQAPLTLGPAALSLPELAQALTKAGMPCTAAPVLADRGAFVCLKNRSPEATRRLLSEALGVAFRPRESGWTIVVDPAAKERERIALVRYRRLVQERAQEWAKERTLLLNGKGFAAYERFAADAVAEFETIPDTPEGKRRIEQEAPAVFRMGSLLDPAAWIALRVAREGTAVGNAVDRRTVETRVPIERVQEVYGVPPDRFQATNVSNPRLPKGVTTTTTFDPRGGVVTIRSQAIDAEGGWSRPRALKIGEGLVQLGGVDTAYLPADGPTIEQTFVRLEQPLPPTVEPPDAPEVSGKASTLSIVLERLGKVGVETVMELSPRFEPMPLSELPERTSLRRALAAPLAPAYQGASALMMRLMGQPPNADLSRLYPWRAAPRDGVWIVSNPYGFLDHAQWISPVPYLAVERVLGEWPPEARRGPGGEPLLDWPKLVTLSRSVPPSPDFRVMAYRNVVAASRFTELLPVVRLVETVPVAQRTAMWRAAATPNGTDVRLASGVLHLQAQVLDLAFGRGTAARLRGEWRGDDGRTWTVVGNLDPTGSLRP